MSFATDYNVFAEEVGVQFTLRHVQVNATYYVDILDNSLTIAMRHMPICHLNSRVQSRRREEEHLVKEEALGKGNAGVCVCV